MLLVLSNNPSEQAIEGLTRNGIVAEIKGRFSPVKLVSDDAAVHNHIRKAVKFFNEFKGVRKIVFLTAGIRGSLPIPAGAKTIASVKPKGTAKLNFYGETAALLGVNLLPNPNAILNVAFSIAHRRQAKAILGTRFQWVRRGNNILWANAPGGTTGLEVTYYAMIDMRNGDPDPENFVVADDYAERWVLDYSEALVRRHEGRTLRKGTLLQASTDGSDMVAEAETAIEKLEGELRANVVFMGGDR